MGLAARRCPKPSTHPAPSRFASGLKDQIQLRLENAHRYAEDALKLAPKFRTHQAYGTAIYMANMTLGGLALREGNTRGAIAYLRAASEAPVSEELAYSEDVVFGWYAPVTRGLIKRGEREAVAQFLDRMARINIARRTDLREVASAIRRGQTPNMGWSGQDRFEAS